MDPIVITSLTVSLIAILVIFTVLVVLIYTIKLLVRLIPYKEPPTAARAKARTSPSAAAVVCQVCLAWLGALLGFPWCPKPATTQMTFSLVA